MNNFSILHHKIIIFIVGALVACVATILLYYSSNRQNAVINENKQDGSRQIIRFMPIGDSYTIGNGARVEERWPNLLVKSLQAEGVEIELISNPAVSGYDASDALAREIPLFEKEKPDFSTLFIGANDAFRQKDLYQFKVEYAELVDRMQSALTQKDHLVLITIPNYAVFPAGLRYGAIEREEQIIEGYNAIIREEAETRNLKVVDLFKIDSMNSADYFISDGIHPSAKGIRVWHDAIIPVVRDVLKN